MIKKRSQHWWECQFCGNSGIYRDTHQQAVNEFAVHRRDYCAGKKDELK